MYDYGLIGNCQASALISKNGSIDWLCMPRPDSEPIFGKILDKQAGHFSISLLNKASSKQYYVKNTNVLQTKIRAIDGAELLITDFFPRFQQFGRVYRPNSLFRIVEPLTNSIEVMIDCNPIQGWNKKTLKNSRANSHLRYEKENSTLRLYSNMPLTYLVEKKSFLLNEPLYFSFTWDNIIEENIKDVSLSFLRQTIDYWRIWVQHCSIPTLYQEETIRSALILKLHCYEDTGAILAALTTSLPEEISGTRNWDYRFCWLRDAYFVLNAFQQIGHFEEMEGFLKFLIDIAHKQESSHERLAPVYTLDQRLPLPEQTYPSWEGYKKSNPVRSNNQAAEHIQNDVYGEMVLALAPIFFDERFYHLRTKDHQNLLIQLTKLCAKNISQPDAGLWELRDGWQEHSFSNLMCWAGIDRALTLQKNGQLASFEVNLAKEKQRAEKAIEKAIIQGTLRNSPKDSSLDASLLQLPLLRFPNENLCRASVLNIAKELCFEKNKKYEAFLYRYKRKDDFGTPHSAFLICSFWLIQAMARIGEKEKAKKLMNQAKSAENHLGLLSEHFHPIKKQQSGNFPQAYSHVGLINAAFSISPSWQEIL